MKIIFAGTPEFAAVSLDALQKAGHEICLVLTQPDRPAGRGMKLQASPVKQRAEEFGIPVYQPEKLRVPGSWQPLLAYQADLMVVVAYGIILPQAVLDIPRLGCLNVHASLLPRWRGAAPIHRAIEHGDETSGVCIMQMDAGLDTGPVLNSVSIPLADRETTLTLHDKLAVSGAELLCQTLNTWPQAAISQPEVGVTYAHKISKSESLIDWHRSAIEIDRQIRAFNPFPAASFAWLGQHIKVWEAEPNMEVSASAPGTVLNVSAEGVLVGCGQGSLLLKVLQLPGSRRMPVSDYLAGHSIHVGDILGKEIAHV